MGLEINKMLIFAFHEHDLKSDADVFEYEREVSKALASMRIPGLLNAYQLKGKKGERMNGYAVLWIFENMAAIDNNFGTFDDPKWPSDWLYYENNILAKYLTCHPDKIHFTDYGLIKSVTYKEADSALAQKLY
jgi:hypothetical protein